MAYSAVVAFGVFGPAPSEPVRQAGEGVRRVAGELDSVVLGQPRAGVPSGTDVNPPFASLGDETIANAALFLPFGLLFTLVFPRWRWFTIPTGVTLSATIELIQLLFLSWRTPSIDDIIWNSVGTGIGFGLWLTACGLLRLRSAA